VPVLVGALFVGLGLSSIWFGLTVPLSGA
jgi:hypothetical protein